MNHAGRRFGAEQPWIRLSEPALRAVAQPLGVVLLTADPTFTAPAVTGSVATGSPTTGPAPTPAAQRVSPASAA
ncbi:hypothetical protein [Streptomyces sp. XY332]|uniref:hypothetical protein n=1 Tax=Streptomyces sp. XY332 TaxID=1415561 RepID=UPI000AD8048F